MKQSVEKVVVCPQCTGELDFQDPLKVVCWSCDQAYPISDKSINFLTHPEGLEGSIASSGEVSRGDFLRKVFNALRTSHTFKTKKSRMRIPQLISAFDVSSIVVNIGAGNTNYSDDVINIDIETTANVDLIADGRSLPIRSASVSFAISQAVLEHTPATEVNLAEIDRILKSNGLFYVEVPFMQTYHAHPHDYYRFTHQGLKSYLKNFDIIEEGIAVGPASAASLNIRMMLATLFSFGNKKLFIIFGVFFGWVTYPIKFLDFFLESNPLAFHSASGIYVLARKKN